MAKRFTDTDKWKRPWFCSLDVKAKLCWFYLLDQCDHRGIWYENYPLMSVQVGFKTSRDLIELWFGSKIHRVDDDKLFIPSFVDFQYGTLNPNNKAHKTVIELMTHIENQGPMKVLERSFQGPQDKDKDTDKDLDKVKEGGVGETNENYSQLADALYQEYPRKVGKSKGVAKLKMILKKSPEAESQVRMAIENYSRHCETHSTEAKFVKHFDTFMNCWEDWVNPEESKDFGKSGGLSRADWDEIWSEKNDAT